MKRGGFIFTAQQMAKSFSTKDRELSYHRQTKSTYCNDDCPSLQKPLQLLSSFRKLLLDVSLCSSIIIPCTLLKKPAESNKMSFPQSIFDVIWRQTLNQSPRVRGDCDAQTGCQIERNLPFSWSNATCNDHEDILGRSQRVPPFSIRAFPLYRQPLHPVGPSVKFHRAMRNDGQVRFGCCQFQPGALCWQFIRFTIYSNSVHVC